MVKLIEKCRICGNKKLESLMLLKNQYLTGVFPRTKTEKITAGDIELVKCSDQSGCGLVQLKQSYDLSEMYGMNYGYRSGLNASMVKHLQSKVKSIIDLNILEENDLIVDIGSNDATTLKTYPQEKYQLVGIDPTGIKFSSYYPSTVKLIPDFFTATILKKNFPNQKAKVITSFSMFYDLEDPVQFARDIEDSLDEDGIWIFEQSYFPFMLKTNSFDTICHEHLEFYSLKQINWIADKVGLKIIDVDFNKVNGGSFSVTAAKKLSAHRPHSNKLNKIIDDENSIGPEDFEMFKNNIEKAKKDLLDFLTNAKSSGKRVCGLGASTKGNVLLQYYGIDSSLIESIGEVNEDKYGCFTPGSHIPLVNENDLLASNPDYLLILPWHFRDFFVNLETLKGRALVFPLPKFEIVKL
jgi:hypothetical protein